MPKSDHVTVAKIFIQSHVEKFTDFKNAILFDLRLKITKLSRKTVSEEWRHQALVAFLANAWPSLIDARRQYILLVFVCFPQYFCLCIVCCLFSCCYHVMVNKVIKTAVSKKRSEETQTLHAVCSKVEPKIFAPPQTPFLGARDGQNLISWRWSLPLPTNPVW